MRGRKDAPLAHFTNWAERVSSPRMTLMKTGVGMLPAAMCAINSGPTAIEA
jgi:hypothetical protein